MKFKIAFISKKMDVGGIEKAALEILNRLDPNLYEVDYYYRRRINEPLGVLIKDIPSWINRYEITIVNKENYKKYYHSFSKRILFWIIYIFSYFMKCADEGMQYALQAKICPCENKEYDLCVAFDGPKAYGLFHAIENIKAKRKILWIHGDIQKEKATTKLIHKYYSQFDNIITVSKDAKNKLVQQFPNLSRKTNIIYNFVDYKYIRNQSKVYMNFFKNHKGIKIATVGRLGPDKGMIMAAKCCKMLKDKNYDIKWIICGEGPEREKIESYIKENDLSDKLILIGNQLNPYPLINECDIYVQPSIQEGFCTTTNEAKVLCKPIITTNVCGMTEQFTNGVNALIVDVDPVEITNAIIFLINNPDKCKKFEKELFNHDWSKQINYDKLFKEYL